VDIGRLQIDPWTVSDGVGVIRLCGEADLHTAPFFRDAVDEAVEAGARSLVVDMSGVTFIDSMMLGVLLGVTRRTDPFRIELRIVVDDFHVRRIFELTLLDRVLALYPSLQQALDRGAVSGK
jgi:anti-sigma B factor antagonist